MQIYQQSEGFKVQNYAKFILAGLCSVKRSTDYQTTALVLPTLHNALILFLVLGTSAVDWFFESLSENSTAWMGDWGEWIKTATKILVFFFLLALSYFFFGAVHAAYLGLFLDGIVDAVRDKHYPEIVTTTPPMMRSTISSTRFVLTSSP